MFLAWKEIKHAKTRFSLIIGVMVLVSYLVFFLVGLAYGLAQDNRTSIDKWGADGIILTDESNTNINMSMMPKGALDAVEADEAAVIGIAPNVIRKKGTSGDDAKINTTFFGIEPDQFLMPEVVEGEAFGNDNEVVADISLKEEEGIELGDILQLAGSEKEVQVVGFTEDAKFSVAPVLYTTVSSYQDVRYEQIDESDEGRISAIVVKGAGGTIEGVETGSEDLVIYPIADYINEIPGYTAQVLTFGLMIGFLVVIAAVVIGIFIYVLTMQKTSMFGVMKAQGISSGYIAKSVVIQTFLLAAIGVGIGLLLTAATAMVLPPAVPYRTNLYFLGGIAVLLVVMAMIGGVFSVRAVVKIDPLKAIG